MATAIIARTSKPKILPGENDSNSFCKICRRTISNKSVYRTHLKNIHKMQVTPLPQLKILHPDIIPDEDDPIGNYRHHLKNVHKMQLKSRLSQFAILHPDIIPDQNNPACEKTFAHKSDYHGHLEAIHKMTIVPKEKFANPHLTPDADGPNHYCCVRHKTMVSRDSYRSH
jgi:hypothetical protein